MGVVSSCSSTPVNREFSRGSNRNVTKARNSGLEILRANILLHVNNISPKFSDTGADIIVCRIHC